MTVLPASFIPLMSTCKLALLSILPKALMSFSLMLSKNTSSSGNLTPFGFFFSGFCFANKLARRLISNNCLSMFQLENLRKEVMSNKWLQSCVHKYLSVDFPHQDFISSGCSQYIHIRRYTASSSHLQVKYYCQQVISRLFPSKINKYKSSHILSSDEKFWIYTVSKLKFRFAI